MITEDMIRELENTAKKYDGKFFGFGETNIPMMCREVAKRLKELSEQSQADKCSECSRRKFYQQGYEEGLNADKWISCEEGLPKEEGEYLVTRQNGQVDIGEFLIWANGGSFNNEYDESIHRFPDKKVIAWQQRPKSYKQN